MVIGLAGGAVLISFIMSELFKRFYTFTFSVVFGIFLSMIPNMLNESCKVGMNQETILSVGVMIIGIVVSYFLGNVEKNN